MTLLVLQVGVACTWMGWPVVVLVNDSNMKHGPNYALFLTITSKLERGYRDCIKWTRDKTRIYSIPHDAPGA